MQQKLLAAIKSDDAEAFGGLIAEKKSLVGTSFGRLPLLSLCFLYGSRRIIKAYGGQLRAITSYSRAEEDNESYLRFRAAAGKCLRLYLQPDSVVSPLEMLALLDDTATLAAEYPLIAKTPQTSAQIKKIYAMRTDRAVKEEGGRLIVAPKPLGFRVRAVFSAIVALAVVFAMLCGAILVVMPQKFGRGTEESPFLVSNVAQLKAIEGTDKYYRLTSDIALNEDWRTPDFGGTLDGNGFCIDLGNRATDGFINLLTGNIKNLMLKATFSAVYTADATAFVSVNEGVIEGVTLTATLSVTLDTAALADEDSIYFSAVAIENKGLISNCTINGDLTALGGGRDAYLSGFVGKNSGEIKDCTYAEGSLSTDLVDVAAIVGTNLATGTLTRCTNRASITQTVTSTTWNPIAAGIAVVNEGIIFECFNEGAVSATAITAIVSEQEVTAITAGGIAGMNLKTLQKCKNSGAVTATGVNHPMYVGGIAGNSRDSAAMIDNCCSYGAITAVLSPEETDIIPYIFIGGIAGYGVATFKNNYNLSAVTVQNDDNAVPFAGAIAGVVVQGVTTSVGNFYLLVGDPIYAYASIIVGNRYYNGLNDGAAVCGNLAEIQSKSVYWG